MEFSSHPLAISLSLEAGRGGFASRGITKTFCQPITYHSLGKVKEQQSKGPGASQLMEPIIGLNPTLLEGTGALHLSPQPEAGRKVDVIL